MTFFKNYSDYSIVLTDPFMTFGIIFIILLSIIVCTARRSSNQFFDKGYTNMLRGLAVISLIFGHLSDKCLQNKMIFDSGGYWAVIIFLFISGYGLYRSYRFSTMGWMFWKKRISRIYIPLWITLVMFILMDHFLIGLNHSALEIALNFIGIHRNNILLRVNAFAWYVEYIMVLYLMYWIASKLPFSENIKIASLFIFCMSIHLIIRYTPLMEYNSIWLQYTMVFPLGVFFGKYRDRIKSFFPEVLWKQIILLVPVFLMLVLLYSWDSFDLPQASRLVQPIFLIIPVIIVSIFYERINLKSGFLMLLGEYSYEIYLLHGPFMAKYDFFLFRKPFYVFFFVYFIFLLLLSFLLAKMSTAIRSKMKFLQFT